jgi:hypothetical protein
MSAFRVKAGGHGFSTETSLLICGSKAAGVPRGMALLVAGRSPRRGGRERSDRWKGESAAFSLQRDAVGNERADEPIPEPLLTRGGILSKVIGTSVTQHALR